MRNWWIPAVFASGVLAGCMASGPPLQGQTPKSRPDATALGVPPSENRSLASTLTNPLIMDRTDLRIGTTVQFGHIPSPSEIHDLEALPGLAHIVLSFPAWPQDYAPLESLNLIPQGADLIAVLPGYPPSKPAADLWRYVNAPLRIVVVVAGPPPDVNAITDLNAMPRLERVIAQMEVPSRSGFERLQRPLSFRKLID